MPVYARQYESDVNDGGATVLTTFNAVGDLPTTDVVPGTEAVFPGGGSAVYSATVGWIARSDSAVDRNFATVDEFTAFTGFNEGDRSFLPRGVVYIFNDGDHVQIGGEGDHLVYETVDAATTLIWTGRGPITKGYLFEGDDFEVTLPGPTMIDGESAEIATAIVGAIRLRPPPGFTLAFEGEVVDNTDTLPLTQNEVSGELLRDGDVLRLHLTSPADVPEPADATLNADIVTVTQNEITDDDGLISWSHGRGVEPILPLAPDLPTLDNIEAELVSSSDTAIVARVISRISGQPVPNQPVEADWRAIFPGDAPGVDWSIFTATGQIIRAQSADTPEILDPGAGGTVLSSTPNAAGLVNYRRPWAFDAPIGAKSEILTNLQLVIDDYGIVPPWIQFYANGTVEGPRAVYTLLPGEDPTVLDSWVPTWIEEIIAGGFDSTNTRFDAQGTTFDQTNA